jgi:hypothetical protein
VVNEDMELEKQLEEAIKKHEQRIITKAQQHGT